MADKDVLQPAQAQRIEELVAYATGSIVSRTILKTPGGSVTLFAFDAGQALSEHTAPFNALAQVLDGTAELVIGGERVQAAAGQTVLLPAGVPHAVNAPARFKMLLTMVRG